jgi:hypothetical protein
MAGRQFQLEGASETEQDWFYYMWTVQNVGHATGYRRFKNIDWYRDATAKLLNSQQPDWAMDGSKGRRHLNVVRPALPLSRPRAAGDLQATLHFDRRREG